MTDDQPSVIIVRDEEGRAHFTSPHSEIAKRAAAIEAAKAAKITEPPRGGAGSGVDAWRDYAAKTGVDFDDTMSRDDIIAAVDLSREEANAAEPSEQSDDLNSRTTDDGPGERQRASRTTGGAVRGASSDQSESGS